MSEIIWKTPAGLIGSFAEGTYAEGSLINGQIVHYSDQQRGGYVEFQLEANDSGGSPLKFEVIAGDITSGLQLSKDGLLHGIPVVEQTSTTTDEFTQTFTVRATNFRGQIKDRTFSVIINTIALPQITPKNQSLGDYYDGYYLDIQLQAMDPNPMAVLRWKLLDGELPLGTTLSSDGKITGFIQPFVNPAAKDQLGWGKAGWDDLPWEIPTTTAQSRTYRFKVQVFDGSRYDNSVYTIFVQPKGLYTVDNNHITTDTDKLTVDLDNRHKPYLVTLPQDLPDQRQDSNFAFQFIGHDLDNDEIRYAAVLTSQGAFDQGPTIDDPLMPWVGFDQGDKADPFALPPVIAFDQAEQTFPPGITLDRVTGWLTGHLGTQVEERKTFTFQIYCYKIENRSFVSDPVTFKLTVLGALDNTVNWVTPTDLGYINNGEISELFVSAVSSKNKVLNYRLKEPAAHFVGEGLFEYTTVAYSKLPQGLKLLPDGSIVGRATFKYFTLDGGTTTIDKGAMTFDYEYTFTVTASDGSPVGSATYDPTISSDKVFKIRIDNYNTSVFENIYLRALPSAKQRYDFAQLMKDTDIFPTNLIYRPADPWFGKAKDIKFLFAAGMNPNRAADYVSSMQNHHFNKRVSLGNVKTAVALDENYNVRYEVVYIEVIDSQEGATYVVDRANQVKAPYSTSPFSVVYPNSLQNMKTELSELGYANRGALPDWMLNQQEDGRVLGFTRAVVLAYTVPGASKLIAYRLKQADAVFNDIDFVADRYQLDHTLTKNYDIDAHKFLGSTETTFDRLPMTGVLHPYAGTHYTIDTATTEGTDNGLIGDDLSAYVAAAAMAMPEIAVDYALRIPFEEVNNRPISYILAKGGLDGSAVIREGQYVIFAKQEKYSSTNRADSIVKDPFDISNIDYLPYDSSVDPYDYNYTSDGWNMDNGLFGGTDYNQIPYASSGIIPGYTESIMSGVTNQRAGIWKVHVSDGNVVTLEFVIPIAINEYIQVKNGRSYGDTKLYYDPVVHDGYTVPAFSILTSKVNDSSTTTSFDGRATRFFSNIDIYETPGTDDAYLKFPKFNIYQ